MRENKLWTADLQSREFSDLLVEGEKEKKAVVCLSFIWSPKRSADVLMKPPCAPARDVPVSVQRMLMGRCVCCVRSFCLLADFFGPLGGRWCYLTWCGILSYLMHLCSACQALYLKCVHLKDGRWFAQSRSLYNTDFSVCMWAVLLVSD